MPGKRTKPEEEFFAREEALKKEKLALDEAKRLLGEQKEELRKTHWMHCPKCGMTLHTITFRGIRVDRCFNCHGTWLDAGELEKVATHEDERKGTWVKSVLHLFDSTKKPGPGDKRK